MKRLFFRATLLTLAIAAYIASPFATAWSIREAVRNGDAAYLEHKIDWPAVRVTLAPTIGKLLLDLPDAEQGSLTEPGLWQRFKAYMGQGAVNSAIESYVTPEGLTKLFNYRKMYRDYVAGQPDEFEAHRDRAHETHLGSREARGIHEPHNLRNRHGRQD